MGLGGDQYSDLSWEQGTCLDCFVGDSYWQPYMCRCLHVCADMPYKLRRRGRYCTNLGLVYSNWIVEDSSYPAAA